MKIKKLSGFKPLGKSKKKHQIILTHTSRKLDNFIASLKYRYNGKCPHIPNYVIGRDGVVFQLLGNTEFTKYIGVENIDKNSINICLENLGWLEKEPLTNQYINWIGDIYNGNVYEKKWRDYYFWQPYTTKQIESTQELCKKLLEEFSIPKQSVGHNTKIVGIEKFEGVTTRSNYESETTDLNPSFDFELFIKKMENE